MRSGVTRWVAVSVAVLGLAGGAQSEVVVLQPGPEGADTSPYEFLPAKIRGDEPSLWAVTSPDHSFRSYIRFDLPPDLVGPDEWIDLAVLQVFNVIDPPLDAGEPSAEPGILECRPVLAPWQEMAVVWSSNPDPPVGAPVDVIEDITTKGAFGCDVTDLVADWADGLGPNYGFAITNPTTRSLGFPSFEAQIDGEPDPNRPSLVISIVPAPEPGAAVGTATAGAALAFLARRRFRARPEPSPR